MKKQSTAVWASVLLVLTAMVLGSLVQYAFYGDDGQEIVMPGEGTAAPDDSAGIAGLNKELLETLEISRDNVKEILATLHRPETYHWESRVTLYSGSRSAVKLVSADGDGSLLRVSVRDGNNNNLGEHLLTDSRYYSWEAGDNLVYAAKAKDFTQSQLLMAIGYEELLQMPDENILSAQVEQSEQQYLVITARHPISGYDMAYRISVEDGMMVSMHAWQNEKEIYRVDRLILEIGVVRAGAFRLPDGSNPEIGALQP